MRSFRVLEDTTFGSSGNFSRKIVFQNIHPADGFVSQPRAFSSQILIKYQGPPEKIGGCYLKNPPEADVDKRTVDKLWSNELIKK